MEVKNWFDAINSSDVADSYGVEVSVTSEGGNYVYADSGSASASTSTYNVSVSPSDVTFKEVETVLFNGSTVNTTAVFYSFDGFTVENSSSGSIMFNPSGEHRLSASGDDSWESLLNTYSGASDVVSYEIRGVAPTGFNDDYVVYSSSSWADSYERLNSSDTYVDQNINALISNIYQNYSAGQVNATDVLTVTDLERQYAGSSDYASVLAQAVLKGYKVDLGGSQSFDVDGDGEVEYTGQLLTRATNIPMDGPNNSTGFEVNKTYNTANFDRSVNILFVDSNGNASIKALSEGQNFTALSATNDAGESIDRWSASTYVSQDASNTDLEAQISAQENVTTFVASSSGGSGGASGGSGGLFDGLFGGVSDLLGKLGLIGVGLVGLVALVVVARVLSIVDEL
jgi:hypothetical protein